LVSGSKWLRLTFGFHVAMTMQGKKPNLFQMLSFLHSADVALADVPFCFYLAPAVNFIFGQLHLCLILVKFKY
jgi:hypothetical protein